MAFGMNFFRKHQGRFLLVIAVFLMLIWFVGGAITKLFAPANSWGTVFGKSVSTQEYQADLRALQILRLGQKVEESDVDQLIVMLHEANRLGIKVTDEEINNGLRQWVMAVTQAKAEDVNATYRMMLEKAGASDAGARAAIEKALLEQKVIGMVAGAVIPSDATLWRQYVKDELQLKLKTLEVKSMDYLAKVAKPAPEQLDAYYKANLNTYKIPKLVTVEYMAVMKKDYAQLFPVKEDEIVAYYEQHKAEDYLLPPVESSAANVQSSAPAVDSSAAPVDSTAPAVESTEAQYKPLAAVSADISAKLAEQKASRALSDARIDMSYDRTLTLKQQADKYGVSYFITEPFSQDDTTKLGAMAAATTERDKTAVEEIFSGTPGEVEFAKTADGMFLFRVADMKEERQPDLAEIKDKVEADYLKAEADKLAMAQASTVLEGLKTKGWAEYQNNPAYKIEDGVLGRDQKVDSMMDVASSLHENDFGGPVLGKEGAYVFQVIERKEPDIAKFSSDKMYLKYFYNMNQRQTFVEAWRKDLVARARITKTGQKGSSGSSFPLGGYGYGY